MGVGEEMLGAMGFARILCLSTQLFGSATEDLGETKRAKKGQELDQEGEKRRARSKLMGANEFPFTANPFPS